MAQQQLIVAIGRIERALSRIEQVSVKASTDDPELSVRHERLKAEMKTAIVEIDKLLAGGRT